MKETKNQGKVAYWFFYDSSNFKFFLTSLYCSKFYDCIFFTAVSYIKLENMEAKYLQFYETYIFTGEAENFDQVTRQKYEIIIVMSPP